MRRLLLGMALSLALAGCGGSDSADDATTELPSEAAEVIDSYTETLIAGDGEAMLAYVTDGFTFLSYGTDVQEREFRATYVTQFYGPLDFTVEEIGERTVVGGGGDGDGDGDEYIVSVPERAVTPAIADGISVLRIVNDDGVWLIDAHRFLGEGEGSG